MKTMILCFAFFLSVSSFAQDPESRVERSLKAKASIYYTTLFNKLYMKYNLEPSFASEIAKDIAYEEYENYLESQREVEEYGLAEANRRREERIRKAYESLQRASELAEKYK